MAWELHLQGIKRKALKNMNTILVPIDFSKAMNEVVETAKKFARGNGAEIVLLHVEAPDPDFVGYDAGPDTVRDSVAQEIKRDFDEIHEIRDKMNEDGIETKALVIQGPTVEKILDEARRLNADFIVMGSHGRGGLVSLIVGSVSEGVIRGGVCPVVVVPALR